MLTLGVFVYGSKKLSNYIALEFNNDYRFNDIAGIPYL